MTVMLDNIPTEARDTILLMKTKNIMDRICEKCEFFFIKENKNYKENGNLSKTVETSETK